ncbi:protein serine threonine kinase [Blomia tropicalis]|nr:protein serine threonine kinase [Blomia tropicalis]
MSETESKQPDKFIKLDPKTEAVFNKKGYRIDKMLNEGAFGQVYRGTNKNDEPVAIKVMDLNAVGDKYKQKFLATRIIGIDRNQTRIRGLHIRYYQKIYIFMEFCSGGDLSGYLTKHGAMPEPLACYWYTQTAKAVHFMHDELRIAHRDIKIDNVLLHNNRVKLTDFGFAKESWDRARNRPLASETFCGTEPYYSPQIVNRKPYNPFCADVWAMGVTLFCMLNNRFPFHFDDPKEMYREQTKVDFLKTRYVKYFPRDLRQLQEAHFIVDETARITMAEVLEHRWIERKGK